VHESAEEVRQVVRAFGDYADGRITSASLNERLSRIAPQGTTEGSLFVPNGYLTIPLMS
jgi:putative protease